MQKIFDVIRQYHMIGPGMRVIAGISGGADSVCLLCVLNEYRKKVPFELRVIHVEHGIRGEESLDDARFTEALCRSMQIPCCVYTADIQSVAAQSGQSLEEAGRAERYRIFEEVRRAWDADRIAVAHNENDQAETLLWNLVRGSGLKGLGGIRPVRGYLIRPLLFTSRTRIEEIVTEAGLAWRTDRTNLETEYTRNRIRHMVLPLLEKELNPCAVTHMAQAAQHLQQMQDYLGDRAADAARQCVRMEEEKINILLEPFFAEEKLIRREILREALSMRGGGLKDIGAVHIRMLEELAEMDCGKECHLPGGTRAVRENGILCLCSQEDHSKAAKKNAAEQEWIVPLPGVLDAGKYRITAELLLNRPELESQIREEKKYTKWLSCDTIKCNVCLRTRRRGDYLIVNGQGGRKKLKDYFIDLKIPREKRDQIWLLADGSHVLWVVGYRISEAAKVGSETKQIVKIQMEEKQDEGENQDFFTGAGSESENC